MDILEQLARQAAETINGGEFYDGKWYTEGQRQAWRRAMTPAAEEIDRLRQQNAELLKALTDLWDVSYRVDNPNEMDAAQAAIEKATGGEW